MRQYIASVTFKSLSINFVSYRPVFTFPFLGSSDTFLIFKLDTLLYKRGTFYEGFVDFIVLNLTGTLWLTYLIFKGKNWARYYILIYIIVSVIPAACYHLYVNFFIHSRLSLENGIHLVFVFMSFYFLFSKDSSLYFKQVKQSVSNKLRVGNNLIDIYIKFLNVFYSKQFF